LRTLNHCTYSSSSSKLLIKLFLLHLGLVLTKTIPRTRLV